MITTKKKIEEFKNKLFEYQKIQDELYDVVYEIFSVAKNYGFAVGSIDHWEMGSDTIGIRWEDSWGYGGYGGYDSGFFDFPIELLYSDYEKYYKDKAEERDKIKLKEEERKQKILLDTEKNLYKELKKKFG